MTDLRLWTLLTCGSMLVGVLVVLLTLAGIQRGWRKLRGHWQVRRTRDERDTRTAREMAHYANVRDILDGGEIRPWFAIACAVVVAMACSVANLLLLLTQGGI